MSISVDRMETQESHFTHTHTNTYRFQRFLFPRVHVFTSTEIVLSDCANIHLILMHEKPLRFTASHVSARTWSRSVAGQRKVVFVEIKLTKKRDLEIAVQKIGVFFLFGNVWSA